MPENATQAKSERKTFFILQIINALYRIKKTKNRKKN
jgi:hypothetical protein